MSRHLVEGNLTIPFRFFFDYDTEVDEGFADAEDAAAYEIENRFEILFDDEGQYYEIEALVVEKS